LPHHLVESFRATLSEVDEADLLLHVVDVSAEDFEYQIESVETVLDAVAPGERDVLLVFNKSDELGGEELAILRDRHSAATFTSAESGEGVDVLLEEIGGRLRRDERGLRVFVPTAHPRSVAQLHELGRVSTVDWEDKGATVQLRVNGPNYGKVIGLPGVEILEIVGRQLH